MIATGLVFLLGALVATLLMLLFVPILWRNAQRLARRDFAATMPATMSEIRAEVDHVRAQAAVTVRRNEMTAQKARERAALERAAVGRLTHSHADLKLRGEQHRDEANSLRATLAQMQQRIDALEEMRLGLEHENAGLRDEITGMEAATRALEAELQDEARRAAPEDRAGVVDDVRGRQEAEPPRVAAATAALLALAKAHRGAPAARPHTSETTTVTGDSESLGSRPSFASEARVVEELSALAQAPRPTDPAERERQNGRVRERIAEVAARIIQMTGGDRRDSRPPSEPAASSAAEPELADSILPVTKAEAISSEAEPVLAQPALASHRIGTKRRRRRPKSRPSV